MSVFVTADLHLSLGNPEKSMDVFGGRWRNYTEKIVNGWKNTVTSEDTVVIAGDISWAMSVGDAAVDLSFVSSLPGRKIIIEGNHDFWWDSVSKLNALCVANGLSIEFLRNNSYFADGIAVCGTRGWYTDERTIPESLADSEKIVLREKGRLERSLLDGKKYGAEPVVFMHFPPVFGSYICDSFVDVMLEQNVKRCYFGHIHGKYDVPPRVDYRGISFYLISADYTDFIPVRVTP